MTSTTTTQQRPASPISTDWTRPYALAVGVLYLITFASSIPALLYFLAPVLNDPRYIVGPGADLRVITGCLLDLVNALACIGTAVAAYPVLRRHSEALALGFVTTRLYEAAVIMIGVLSLLGLVALRQDLGGVGGAQEASLLTTGHALVAIRDYTFVLGPNIGAALNALMFGTVLYRFRLVPRILPTMGLIAAPLLIAASVATVLGLIQQGSIWYAPGGVLIFTWELALGIYLVVRGFKRTPITATLPEAGN